MTDSDCHNRKTAKQDGGFGNRKKRRDRAKAAKEPAPEPEETSQEYSPAEPWVPSSYIGERYADESVKAFHAFSHYRDLPPSSRSIDVAWAEHEATCRKHRTSTKRAPGNWKAWSAANDWPGRAADHDDDLSRRRRERRAAELATAEDAIADAARLVLDRVTERLSTMEHEELSTNVLHSWLKAAADVLPRALGRDDKKVVEVQGDADLMAFIRERAAADGIDPDAAVAEAERMLEGVMDNATGEDSDHI